jgi:ribosomal protein L11 methyltransferase
VIVQPASPTPWWELRVHVPAAATDDAAGLLIDGGALGVEVRDGQPGRTAELVVSYADGAAADLRVRARTALRQIGIHVSLDAMAVTGRADQAWGESWKAFFKPLRLGDRLWVVPSWHCAAEGCAEDPTRVFAAPDGHIVIQLDPGMAFGTGQHATTALCAELVEQDLAARDPAENVALRVLDLGCGSGILAIAAAKLGAGHVLAVDSDPIAVAAAVDNCERNGVTHAVQVHEGSADAVVEPCDLLVANILAPTLCELAPAVLARLRPRGRLVLSGILTDQATLVVETYLHHARILGPSRLALVEERVRDEWVALVLAVD